MVSSTQLTRTLPWLSQPVSGIGLGSAAFGGSGWAGSWGRQDDDVTVKTVRRAVELGINWVDTAPIYGNGHAEEVVGKAVKAFPDAERPLDFTKGGLQWDDDHPLADPARVGTPASLREGLFASLRRLKLDCVDLYQVHWPPEDGTSVEDVWSTMLDLRREGWVRGVGVSNYDLGQLEASSLVGPVGSVQLHLNLLHRERSADVVPWCSARNVPVLAFGTLQHGLLTDRMTPDRLASLPPDDWRTALPDFASDRREVNLFFTRALAAIASSQGIP